MAGIGKEGARVGQHSDKVAEDGEIGKADELILHSLLVVVEPPSTAVLELAGDFGALERADDGVDALSGTVQHR